MCTEGKFDSDLWDNPRKLIILRNVFFRDDRIGGISKLSSTEGMVNVGATFVLEDDELRRKSEPVLGEVPVVPTDVKESERGSIGEEMVSACGACTWPMCWLLSVEESGRGSNGEEMGGGTGGREKGRPC